MAPGDVARCDLDRRRCGLAADAFGQRTARVEPAASWDYKRGGQLPHESRLALRSLSTYGQLCLKQPTGVGMVRLAQHRAGRSCLKYLAQVHHGYVSRKMGDNGKLVRDEDNAEPEVFLQLGEQVQDLCLYRDVQRTDRLVCYQDLGLGRQSSGDGHSLPLAPGKLPWITCGILGTESAALEEIGNHLLLFGAVQLSRGRGPARLSLGRL